MLGREWVEEVDGGDGRSNDRADKREESGWGRGDRWCGWRGGIHECGERMTLRLAKVGYKRASAEADCGESLSHDDGKVARALNDVTRVLKSE